MTTQPTGWHRCNSCKGDIDFEQGYYVCSVSTCNRRGTDLKFCSVECWDAHVPVMRHRDAWAEEKRAPSRAEWEQENAEAAEEDMSSASASGGDDSPSTPLDLNDGNLPRDILVVASKLKAYIRARSGMNTSDGVMGVLSDRLRNICDEGIRNAHRAGRKTVMDRDFKT
jgi:hypothetical protein